MTKTRSKLVLSILFSFSAAVPSAFLDALTITVVLISVGVGFYTVCNIAKDLVIPGVFIDLKQTQSKILNINNDTHSKCSCDESRTRRPVQEFAL
ncbi:MAG: hypothetical protein AAF434_12060 [Pseudomonadota bacterium]